MTADLHSQAVQKIEQIAESYYDLGEILTEIVKEETYEQMGYVGAGAFEKYCLEELGKSYQVVRSYIKMYTNLTSVGISKEDLKGIAFRAAEQIARIVTEESKDTWLEKARNSSVRQLTAEISSILDKAKDPSKSFDLTDSVEDSHFHKMTYRYDSQDYEFMQKFLALANRKYDCAGNKNQAQLKAAQEYMMLAGDREISAESFLNIFNSHYGFNLSIQDALASKERGVKLNA